MSTRDESTGLPQAGRDDRRRAGRRGGGRIAPAGRRGGHGELAGLGRARRAAGHQVVLRHLGHPRQPRRHERQRRDVRQAQAVGGEPVRPLRGRRALAGALPAGGHDRADPARQHPQRREEHVSGVQEDPRAAGGGGRHADGAVGLEPDRADLQQEQDQDAADLVRGAPRQEVQGPRRLQRPARVPVAGRRLPARLRPVQDEQGAARQGQGRPHPDQAQRARPSPRAGTSSSGSTSRRRCGSGCRARAAR